MLLHGVVTSVFSVVLSGAGGVVGARFRPGGFAARFGQDASVYTDTVRPADPALTGGRIERRLDPSDPAASADAIDAAVGSRDGPVDPTYAALVDLMARLQDDSDVRRVGQVMDLSPWSERTTQRVFRRYVGVPVKWVLARYRLQHAALAIEIEPGVDLAELAVRLGWYDQAHFTNDFRSQLGCAPGEYARRHGAGHRS